MHQHATLNLNSYSRLDDFFLEFLKVTHAAYRHGRPTCER